MGIRAFGAAILAALTICISPALAKTQSFAFPAGFKEKDLSLIHISRTLLHRPD